ncbi:LytR family transcriptional regulator [Macrococcus brunensis]|uniref:LytR family transcriptional regulator n=1 Tax=Macrococcus brunensis TaxID=198483 RepID=A0A4R6BE74_9STAP|nr:response regulator transcription factor [Macrococcus brunensis]TDL98110.1 LytR family transcriptional regulator [Macrococcus brunensis]
MTLLESVRQLENNQQLSIVAQKEARQTLSEDYRTKGWWIESFTEPLHERLTVKEAIKFYVKWYGSAYTVDQLMQMFYLENVQKARIKHISHDDYVLIKLCVALIQPCSGIIFHEILHNLHIETINKIRQIMPNFEEKGFQVIHLLAHIDHAMLLTDTIYQVKNDVIKKLDIETREKEETAQEMQVFNVFKLAVKSEDKTLFLNPEAIDFIEGSDGKVNIHLNNESFLADYSLTELEEKLQPYGFYRCHRSYIVNLQKVKEMITWSKNSYSIKLDSSNENFVPLSRAKLKEFQTYFNGTTVPFTEK